MPMGPKSDSSAIAPLTATLLAEAGEIVVCSRSEEPPAPPKAQPENLNPRLSFFAPRSKEIQEHESDHRAQRRQAIIPRPINLERRARFTRYDELQRRTHENAVKDTQPISNDPLDR